MCGKRLCFQESTPKVYREVGHHSNGNTEVTTSLVKFLYLSSDKYKTLYTLFSNDISRELFYFSNMNDPTWSVRSLRKNSMAKMFMFFVISYSLV